MEMDELNNAARGGVILVVVDLSIFANTASHPEEFDASTLVRGVKIRFFRTKKLLWAIAIISLKFLKSIFRLCVC